jgi:uncharacterized protein YbaP (TraB family)
LTVRDHGYNICDKSIRRRTAIVLILAFVLGVSCTPTTKDESLQKSFLWEATCDVTTVYILGSVHIAKADLYPLNSTIEDAYALSQNLVLEIEMNSENIAKTEELLIDKGAYPPGENLQSNIPNELYARVKDRLFEIDPSGTLLFTLNLFEPWVVATTITDLEYIELGYDAEYGIDKYFQNKAEVDGKDILELESVEFQFDIFDSMPDDLQVIMLEDAIENPISEEEMEIMFDAWSTGDTDQMEQLLFGSIEEEPEYSLLYDKIIDERNFQMIEAIESYLEDDEIYFVVVGAGHLLGENGIINLLAEQGYKVNQL